MLRRCLQHVWHHLQRCLANVAVATCCNQPDDTSEDLVAGSLSSKNSKRFSFLEAGRFLLPAV